MTVNMKRPATLDEVTESLTKHGFTPDRQYVDGRVRFHTFHKEAETRRHEVIVQFEYDERGYLERTRWFQGVRI